MSLQINCFMRFVLLIALTTALLVSAQPSDQDLGANNGLAGGKGDVLVQDGDDLPITPSTGTSTVAGNVGASAGFTASMVPAAVVCVGSLLAMLFS